MAGELARVPVGGLLEQFIDVGAAGEVLIRAAQQQADVVDWLARTGHSVHLHSASVLLSVRLPRNRWLRTAGILLPVMSAISASGSPSKWRRTMATRCGGGRAVTASVTASTVRFRSVCWPGPSLASLTSPSRSRDSVIRAPGNPVQRPAGDDLVQPGGKAGIRPESGQLLPGGDERFLGDVLSVLMVPEQPQRHPVGQQAVTVNEIGVRVNVAFLGPPDQVAIVDL